MTLPIDQQEQYISIWAKTVDTQMHFNEMSVKSRQLGLAFVAAALGVAVVLMTRGAEYALKADHPPLHIPPFHVHLSVIIIIASIAALWAVRSLDLNVYHQMLRGAVTFGEDFEEHYMKQIFKLNKGMTQTISHYSRYKNATKTIDPSSGIYVYGGGTETKAEDKLKKFYRTTLLSLWIAAFAVFIITNLDVWSSYQGKSDTSTKTAISDSMPHSSASPSKIPDTALVITTPEANQKDNKISK